MEDPNRVGGEFGNGTIADQQFCSGCISLLEELTYKEYFTGLPSGTYPGSPLENVRKGFIIDIDTALSALDPSFRPRPLKGYPMPM
jgi:hypothetical protein